MGKLPKLAVQIEWDEEREKKVSLEPNILITMWWKQQSNITTYLRLPDENTSQTQLIWRSIWVRNNNNHVKINFHERLIHQITYNVTFIHSNWPWFVSNEKLVLNISDKNERMREIPRNTRIVRMYRGPHLIERLNSCKHWN